MTAPRVLHVISGLRTGGAESFLAQLSPRLARRGFDQRIVGLSGDGPMAAVFEANGLPLHRFDARGVTNPVKVLRSLARLIREYRPDVVQGWMYHGDFFSAVAHRMAGKHDTRLFWNVRCSDMRLGDYALQLRLLVRGCIALSSWPDLVIVNSEAGAASHTAAGYRPRRMEVIGNGVDVDRFRPDPAIREEVRRELGIGDSTRVIVHAARVDPMKDHPTLLAAVAGLPDVTTLLIGKGTEALDLPAGVMALGLRRDIPRLLAAGDIVVSSSAYGEGFSNAVAEGMASGLVPVATRTGDVEEIIGTTGEVVPPRSVDELRAALERVLMMPDAIRRALGDAARERVEARFGLDRIVDRYEALYRGVDQRAVSAAAPGRGSSG
jgi:glycosyltransferase involved in cell wall biosynthesis